MRLTWGGGWRECQMLLWSRLLYTILKTKQSIGPHHTCSRRSSSSATPLSLPAPDSHREHDLHQGNSVNGIAHWHHPWASEYTPTLLSPTVNLFFLQCLSVCWCACSRRQNTNGMVKGTTCKVEKDLGASGYSFLSPRFSVQGPLSSHTLSPLHTSFLKVS